MNELIQDRQAGAPFDEKENQFRPSRHRGFKLLRKILAYHLTLGAVLLVSITMYPGVMDYLPVGGVSELAGEADASAALVTGDKDQADDHLGSSVFKATKSFDRLGYGADLVIVLIGVWLLVLPVSWVHKGIHEGSAHDRSLDETVLILPGIVATIVMVVQHSLALAFSLAGIVAGVQFRRALQDTFDALFILVAIGTGLSAGVGALEISTVMTLFFCYSTLYIYFTGDGLESQHEGRRKELKDQKKQQGKKKASQREEDKDDD